MSTRSFLLLGLASSSAYAAQCTADASTGFTQVMSSHTNCLLQSLREESIEEYCVKDECREKLEEMINFEFPDCTIGGQKLETMFGPSVDQLLGSYNRNCNTKMVRGDSSNTDGGDKTGKNGADATDTNGSGATDTGDDVNDTPGGDETDTGNDASEIDSESSNAHGYSVAHYMTAILVPMALLCL